MGSGGESICGSSRDGEAKIVRLIKASSIKLNTRFDSPLYFDDRKYMFLAPYAPARLYHLDAIKKWHIEVFFTDGNEVGDHAENIEEI